MPLRCHRSESVSYTHLDVYKRQAPSNGLKRGVVVNIDATVQSIQQALKEAELMADCKITRVYTGITGSHIRGQNSTGMVIVRDNREVTTVDVARVVETAKRCV